MNREEAIEIIKRNCVPGSKLHEACALFLPELKESEDERIRKEINTLYSEIDTCISELLKARTDKDSEAEGKALFKMEGLMVATLQDLSCIEDYLEKQIEQSSLNTKQKCLAGTKRVQEYQDLSDWEKEFDNIASIYAHNKNKEGYNNSWYVKERAAEMLYHAKKELEKQKEQKSIRTDFRNAVKILMNLHKIKNEFTEEDYDFQAKELLELVEQKPAGWSEDEERLINTSIYFLKDFADKGYENAVECIDWLKALPERVNLQPKQEWSEEDEGHLQFVIGIIGSDLGEDSDTARWLKALPERVNLQKRLSRQ